MKLITKEIEDKLLKTPLYTNEHKDPAEVPILVKFFYPYGRGTWYVTEAEKQEDGDWLFFGLADVFEKELGYFTLSELESIKFLGNPKLGVERDLYYKNHTLAEVQAGSRLAA